MPIAPVLSRQIDGQLEDSEGDQQENCQRVDDGQRVEMHEPVQFVQSTQCRSHDPPKQDRG